MASLRLLSTLARKASQPPEGCACLPVPQPRPYARQRAEHAGGWHERGPWPALVRPWRAEHADARHVLAPSQPDARPLSHSRLWSWQPAMESAAAAPGQAAPGAAAPEQAVPEVAAAWAADRAAGPQPPALRRGSKRLGAGKTGPCE